MTSNDTLALLARENPVLEQDLPSAQGVEAQALKERILLTELAPAQPRGAAPRRLRPPRRPLALATTAAVVVVVVFATLPRALPDEHLGASPAAAAVLERAADAATASSGAGRRYAYTRARTLYGVTRADDPVFTALVSRVRETWVAADGSGRIVESPGTPTFLGPRDRARWLAAGSPPLTSGEARDQRVRARYQPVPAELLSADPDELDLGQLDRLLSAVPQLPTDPDRLERIIRAYAEQKDPPVEAAMFDQVSGLLHSPYGSAELRAAAYRVLSRIEGVDVGRPRRDGEGRLGTVITAPAGYGGSNEATADPEDSTLNDQQVRRLIIDAQDGIVLAEEEVLTTRVDWIDGKPGDTVGAIVILEQGWVDSLDRRPEGNRTASGA